MSNVFDVLKERGFIAQTSNEEEIREMLGSEKVYFYTGYDPTADSLHVGHFLQAVAMRHLQNHGHVPIILIGGGTTMVGDPSGRTDMRQMMTQETIAQNGERFKEQLSRFIDVSDGKALLVNNADWLLSLNYISFLREVGVHFSVNRMLGAECFKSRMDKEAGLSFLEFNYMIMQAFDFYELNQRYGCKLQMGGDDQWSNILAGADLIRRKTGKSAYAMTFNLLTRSDGVKMGKTLAGAVWLDKEKTCVYDFFQYWRNIEDASVEKCLSLLTFLPMEEVRALGALEGSQINHAKEVLAFELTKMVHGEEEATKALEAAKAIFAQGSVSEDAPTTFLPFTKLKAGVSIVELLTATGLASSNGEARRLIQQGGITINDEKVISHEAMISENHQKNGVIMIRKGKKVFHQVKVETQE